MCRTTTTYGVAASHVSEIEDQRNPGVFQPVLEAQVRPQAKNGRLAEEGLVIVLKSICDAHLPFVSWLTE